jgi:hypothetical protein
VVILHDLWHGWKLWARQNFVQSRLYRNQSGHNLVVSKNAI